MNKIIKGKVIYFSILFLGLLSGCSSTPSAKMTSLGGKFYMVGDSNCAYYKQRDENSILCANESKQPTGYRNALSDQELQYKMHRERIQQAESAEFNRSLESLNRSVNSINQNMSNQINSFNPSQYDLRNQRSKPINCNSYSIGNNINTQCY
jgi:hypothetical protein